MDGKIVAICICPTAGGEMQEVQEVEAVAGGGLKGDRYEKGEGSFQKGDPSRRPVTFINARFFAGTTYEYRHSRRNFVTLNVELMWLIGREFDAGTARFLGVKYCDPCERPRKLSGKEQSFRDAFFDCGGLIAEVVRGGIVRLEDSVIPPPKRY